MQLLLMGEDGYVPAVLQFYEKSSGCEVRTGVGVRSKESRKSRKRAVRQLREIGEVVSVYDQETKLEVLLAESCG